MIRINHNKSLLAAVKSGGKTIWIIDLLSKEIKLKLIRGWLGTLIKSIDFSFDDRFLALTSDKLSVHIFDLVHLQSPRKIKSIPETKSFMKFKT